MTTTNETTPAASDGQVTGAAAMPAGRPAHGTLLREAFEKHLPAIMALPADDLLPLNVDLQGAVTTGLGVAPEVEAMRPQIARELPYFDLDAVDSLDEYALALGHALLEHQSASASDETLARLNVRAMAIRETFFADVNALVKRKLLKAEQVSEYKGLTGYKNVAFELLGLTGVLRQSWSVIGSRTAVEPSELDESELLGQQMLTIVGAREQGPSVLAETAQRRQRAFTLFARKYDAVRRAISYLRWEQGDVDSIIPSLYAGRGGRPKKASEPKPEKTTEPQPAVTPVKPASEPAVPVGFPGGSPFLR